ncbi:MAG: hypothetical protein JSW20_04035 [Nitrospiraceae bacterium]|nr:MAG: hypothetical protein JSW20_04035 [Nitrospiraceae bacterium]
MKKDCFNIKISETDKGYNVEVEGEQVKSKVKDVMENCCSKEYMKNWFQSCCSSGM